MELDDSTLRIVLALSLAVVLMSVIYAKMSSTRKNMKASSRNTNDSQSSSSTVISTAPQLKLTKQELAKYNGTSGNPVYIAVQNPFSDTGNIDIFDMSSGISFYGPGGPYHVFAGKNASYGLGKTSTDEKDVQGDISLLSASEKDTLTQWYVKYLQKYPKVGLLVDESTQESVDLQQIKKDN